MNNKKHVCCGFRVDKWDTTEDNQTFIQVAGCPNAITQAACHCAARFAGQALELPYVELEHIAKLYCLNYDKLPEQAKLACRHKIILDSQIVMDAMRNHLDKINLKDRRNIT